MPEFMDVHTSMHGVTPEALHEAHQADLAIQGEENVNFKQAWGDPDSGMDSLRSRIFRVPARRPFLSTGDARRACLAYAEMLIDAGGSSRAIWEPV